MAESQGLTHPLQYRREPVFDRGLGRNRRLLGGLDVDDPQHEVQRFADAAGPADDNVLGRQEFAYLNGRGRVRQAAQRDLVLFGNLLDLVAVDDRHLGQRGHDGVELIGQGRALDTRVANHVHVEKGDADRCEASPGLWPAPRPRRPPTPVPESPT